MNSVSVHFAGQNFPYKISKCYLNSSVPILFLRGGMSVYSYRISAPKTYKNIFLLIGDVIHPNSDLSFPDLSQKNIHPQLWFIFQDRIEFLDSQFLY